MQERDHVLRPTTGDEATSEAVRDPERPALTMELSPLSEPKDAAAPASHPRWPALPAPRPEHPREVCRRLLEEERVRRDRDREQRGLPWSA